MQREYLTKTFSGQTQTALLRELGKYRHMPHLFTVTACNGYTIESFKRLVVGCILVDPVCNCLSGRSSDAIILSSKNGRSIAEWRYCRDYALAVQRLVDETGYVAVCFEENYVARSAVQVDPEGLTAFEKAIAIGEYTRFCAGFSQTLGLANVDLFEAAS